MRCQTLSSMSKRVIDRVYETRQHKKTRTSTVTFFFFLVQLARAEPSAYAHMTKILLNISAIYYYGWLR